MSKRIAAAVVMVLAVCANASAREGFGFTKKAADMKMTVPPAINVIGTRVALDVKGAAPADIHVSVDVDRVDVDHDSRSKVEYVSEQRCCDKNGKKYSVSVPRTKHYTTVEARLEAEYKITRAIRPRSSSAKSTSASSPSRARRCRVSRPA